MHITVKEKASAAKPVHDVLAAGWAVSDCGECAVVGNRCPFSARQLTVLQP